MRGIQGLGKGEMLWPSCLSSILVFFVYNNSSLTYAEEMRQMKESKCSVLNKNAEVDAQAEQLKAREEAVAQKETELATKLEAAEIRERAVAEQQVGLVIVHEQPLGVCHMSRMQGRRGMFVLIRPMYGILSLQPATHAHQAASLLMFHLHSCPCFLPPRPPWRSRPLSWSASTRRWLTSRRAWRHSRRQLRSVRRGSQRR